MKSPCCNVELFDVDCDKCDGEGCDGEPTEFVLHQINEQLRQRVAELEAENARLNKIANPTYSAEKTREESAVRLRKIKELRAENEQLNNQHASDVNTIMEQEALLKAKEAIIKGTGGLHRVVKELTAENAELSKSVHVSIVEGENKKLRQRVAELEAELVEKTEAEAGDHVGDDRVERSADNDSPTGPTPLSEPLCVTAPESTDAGCIRACMRMNKERIEQRYAEVVAAIAELRQEVERCKNRYDKLIPREFAETNRDRIAKMKENHQNKLDKMQEQIESLAARCRLLENEDQNQHDSLTDQGHAIDEHRLKIEALEKCVAMAAKMGWIFQDADDYQTYAEKIEAMQTQIDALQQRLTTHEGDGTVSHAMRLAAMEKRIDFHAVNNPLNGNPDDISLHELISVVDQRCALIEQVLGGMTEEATFEKIDALTEAVLMLLDEHRAEKQGMRMWGSGDFERMANKLRERGESDG